MYAIQKFVLQPQTDQNEDFACAWAQQAVTKKTTCRLTTTARIIMQIIFVTLCSLITLRAYTEWRNPTKACRSYSQNKS